MRSPVSSPAAAAASAARPPPPLRPPALRLPLLDEAFAREPLLCFLKAEFDGWDFRVGCLALEGVLTDLGPAERSDRACDEDPRSRLDAPRSRPVLTRAGVSFCGLSIPDTPSNCGCGGRLALAASSCVRASPPPCDRASERPARDAGSGCRSEARGRAVALPALNTGLRLRALLFGGLPGSGPGPVLPQSLPIDVTDPPRPRPRAACGQCRC